MGNGSLNVDRQNEVHVGHSRGGSEAESRRAVEEKVCHSRRLARKTKIPDKERTEIKMNRNSLLAQEQGWL